MAPPAAEGDEGQPALFGDRLDHEADLVEVAVQQHPRRRGGTAFLAQQTSQPIVGDLAGALELRADDRTDLILGAGRSGGQGESAQQIQGVAHGLNYNSVSGTDPSLPDTISEGSMSRTISDLERIRLDYAPRYPAILDAPLESILAVEAGRPTAAIADDDAIRERFAATFGRPVLATLHQRRRGRCGAPPARGRRAQRGTGARRAQRHHRPVRRLRSAHPARACSGFAAAREGFSPTTGSRAGRRRLAPYRNTGGFDLIGSGRDKIETDEQFKSRPPGDLRRKLGSTAWSSSAVTTRTPTPPCWRSTFWSNGRPHRRSSACRRRSTAI